MARRRSAGASARPVRQSRNRVTSYNEDSSSDLQISDEESTSVTLRPRIRRNNQYREQSTDAELESDEPFEPGTRLDEPGPTNPIRAPANKSRRVTRSSTSTTPKKRGWTGPPSRAPLPKKQYTVPTVSSEVIPPWQSLPYHILLDIFFHISYPLGNDPKLASTLVGIARLCRAFFEPAMAALYYSPPITTPYQAHRLLILLTTPLELLLMNYAQKIKELHIDAETILTYKSGRLLGYFRLEDLLARCPALHTLRIYHPDDKIIGIPPWALKSAKWSYSNSLFAAIESCGVRLRRWEWNGRFFSESDDDPIPRIESCHDALSFNGMKDLQMIRLQGSGDFDHEIPVNPTTELSLIRALEGLPQLERLEFVECTLLTNTILTQLPLGVRFLTICNCDRLTALSIQDLLEARGDQLRELNLDHNRYMSMSFRVESGPIMSSPCEIPGGHICA
ncbi:hypothetical protein N7470_010237 [Penicillium chermesinum]|nr:hypothetical protein N7470_010237 [Penicillium chermesinum]